MDNTLKLLSQLQDQFSDAVASACESTQDEIAIKYAIALLDGLKNASVRLSELLKADIDARIQRIVQKAGLS